MNTAKQITFEHRPIKVKVVGNAHKAWSKHIAMDAKPREVLNVKLAIILNV